ncbi:type II toxin-antitoxin system PemK/MazF family toxin [Jiella endophytica]|uniref:Type II toxin-antitoxin system PemK/MazF family toxin n=1 Tax=Jiella endophytica TaxID=2558362 RepID=A0A4Y8RGT3_9HYPH|nr:type II toxin-antitoxin system PemK/MazF family toxin [Jiella endophytica]TFF21929.1 type II toxin-antitoxin system PemK/MazF family toxin [Jiella endophytica]
MKRGDVVLVSGQGDYGKARPAIVVQADHFAEYLGSITVVPLTSDLAKTIDLRVRIKPRGSNGLRAPSDAMVDKIQTYPRKKVFDVIGALEVDEMIALNRSLVVFLQLAGTILGTPAISYPQSQEGLP